MSATRALLAVGAAVDRAMDSGVTPLYMACTQGHAAVVSALLAAGAAVDQAKDGCATPLYIACYKGHAAVVSALLAAGAAVEQAEDGCATPLLFACQQGHAAVVSALLAAGAAVDRAAGVYGDTPLFAAIHQLSSFANVSIHYEHLASVRILSSYGARRTATLDGLPIEELAQSRGMPEAHAWLVQSRGWSTPLHHLADVGAARARSLLRRGASLHASSLLGQRVRISDDVDARDGLDGTYGLAASFDDGLFTVTLEAGAGALVAAPPLPATSLQPVTADGAPASLDTPLTLARALGASGEAPAGSAAALVLRAAAPWAPPEHELWPDAARARAAELCRIGYQLAYQRDAPAMGEIWATGGRGVIAHVLEAERGGWGGPCQGEW